MFTASETCAVFGSCSTCSLCGAMSRRICLLVLVVYLLSLNGSTWADHSHSKRLGGNKIVGGSKVEISSYPYQGAYQWVGHQICGCAIISSNYVLTAAHCIQATPYRLFVSIRVGSTWSTTDGTVCSVKDIMMHTAFDQDTLVNDVGLVLLRTSLIFTASIAKIDLVPCGSDPVPGQLCTVTGWGLLKETDTKATEELQAVSLPVVARSVCNETYVKHGHSIHLSTFCAGGDGKDSCQGDSGGPIIILGKLAGLVSWGKGCARQGVPGVYSRIGHEGICVWIQEKAGLPQLSSGSGPTPQ